MDRALDEWSALLNCRGRPNVRNAKQTCHSIAVMAALFRLMGKVTENPAASAYVETFALFLFITQYMTSVLRFSMKTFLVDLNCIIFIEVCTVTHYVLSLSDHFGHY